MSDANYAAVKAGVEAGDVVLVRPTAADNTQQNQFNFRQMTNPDRQQSPGGGSFPGGGQFPGGGRP